MSRDVWDNSVEEVRRMRVGSGFHCSLMIVMWRNDLDIAPVLATSQDLQ